MFIWLVHQIFRRRYDCPGLGPLVDTSLIGDFQNSKSFVVVRLLVSQLIVAWIKIMLRRSCISNLNFSSNCNIFFCVENCLPSKVWTKMLLIDSIFNPIFFFHNSKQICFYSCHERVDPYTFLWGKLLQYIH